MSTVYLFNWEKNRPDGQLMIVETTHELLHYQTYNKGKPIFPKPRTAKLSLDDFIKTMAGLDWYRI